MKKVLGWTCVWTATAGLMIALVLMVVVALAAYFGGGVTTPTPVPVATIAPSPPPPAPTLEGYREVDVPIMLCSGSPEDIGIECWELGGNGE